ncbi:MAG: carbohydrate kinase family protein [Mogibacterium sp.]|nr:carbohydrate kinase family protein [Mogibacterium sp.]
MEQGYMVYIGTTCVDEYYTLHGAWPVEGDKFLTTYDGRASGGMIANAASVMAGFGVKTFLLCQLFRDQDYDFLIQDLLNYNIDPSQIITLGEGRNTKCQIITNKGERTIHIMLGSNKPKISNEAILPVLSEASYIYSTIGNLEVFEDPVTLLAELHKAGVKVVFDIEPNGYIEDWRDYIPYCSIMFMNEFALELFACGKDARAFEQELLDCGVEIVVETLGGDGCRAVCRECAVEVPACAVEVVDTTGAGDTFNSAFTYAIYSGKDLTAACEFATAAAGRAVTLVGGRSGVTTVDVVEAFRAEHM